MSDTNVPTRPPQPVAPADLGTAEGPVFSHLMVQHCESTRKWVLFIAILATVLCSIGIVAMLVVAATGMPTRETLFPMPGYYHAAGSIGLVLSFLVALGLYVPALVHLYRYASFLKRFVAERNALQLENALGSQKSFWKYAGILCIVGLGVSVLAMIISIAAALSSP